MDFLKKNKIVIIAITGIVALLLIIKIFANLLYDSGLINDSREEKGELKIINKIKEEHNKELQQELERKNKEIKVSVETLSKTEESFKKTDTSTTKVINDIKKQIETINKEKPKKQIKHNKKQLVNKKVTVHKEIVKPKVIKIDKTKYEDAGKVLINNLLKTYNCVRDTK